MERNRRIGIVTLKPTGDRSWLMRYRDPATGRDVRRRLHGLTEREVVSVASTVNHCALSTRGFLPGKPERAPTLKDAFAEWIRLCQARPKGKVAYARDASHFVAWISKRYPRVETWCQLRPVMVEGYRADLERRGLSYHSIRLALVPVRAAWKHVATNHPDLVRPLPKLRMPAPPKQSMDCLRAGEVGALLDWMRQHNPDFLAFGCLAGLAGMRMLEIAALRRADLDFEKGTVAICATGHHVPKTPDSHRVIPVCPEAMDSLRAAVATQRIHVPGGELFVTGRGNLWSEGSLTQKWKSVMRRAARDTGNPRYVRIPARRLRSAFATMAARPGIEDRLVRAYLGHSGVGILSRHYQVVTAGDLASVSSRMERWRELPSDDSSWQFPGIPQEPGVENA